MSSAPQVSNGGSFIQPQAPHKLAVPTENSLPTSTKVAMQTCAQLQIGWPTGKDWVDGASMAGTVGAVIVSLAIGIHTLNTTNRQNRQKANLVATRCLPSLKAAYEALVRVHGEYRVRIDSDGSMNNEDKTDVLSSLNQYFADEHEQLLMLADRLPDLTPLGKDCAQRIALAIGVLDGIRVHFPYQHLQEPMEPPATDVARILLQPKLHATELWLESVEAAFNLLEVAAAECDKAARGKLRPKSLTK